MQSPFIKYILTSEIAHALFRTLMHSLWQAILLALVAAIILMQTKKTGAELRYKLLSGILLCFVFISTATFCYELTVVANYNNASIKNIFPVINYNTPTNNKGQVSFAEKIISAFQSVENFIVVLWFIIITLKCINLLTGLRSIYLLKRRQVFCAGEYWNNQLKQLTAKAGVTKQVRLLKSAIIKVPMVLGHLKPVILFPASALTSLAPAEIEAILLHELAHIRRKDYLINILQSITEIIFFFNPAALWISSLIKEERENCCDDIAVGQMKNKKQFIHALVSFQEYSLDLNYAPSFSGRRNYLLNRVRRIITNNNKTLNNMEKTLLIAGIIITCCAVFAFSQNKQPITGSTPEIKTVKTFESLNKKDTVPKIVNDNESKYVINTSIDDKQYKLVEENGKVIEFYVNNARIPDDKISSYSSVINKLQEKLKADKKKQVEEMKAQQEELTVQSELMKENAMEQKEEMEKQAEEMKEQAKEMQDDMNRQNEEMESQKKELQEQQEEMKKNMLEQKEEMERQADEMKQQAKELEEEMKQNKMEDDTATIIKQKASLLKNQKAYLADAMLAQQKAIAQVKTEMAKNKTLAIKQQKEYIDKMVQAQTTEMAAKAEVMKQTAAAMKEQLEKEAEKIKAQQDEIIQQLKDKQQTP